jgi:hypothetical protein
MREMVGFSKLSLRAKNLEKHLFFTMVVWDVPREWRRFIGQPPTLEYFL